jgi:predicted transposase YbfD/YdcC
MDVEAPRGLLRFFDDVEDPRMNRTKRHLLTDILGITICAVTCGADTWTAIETYGRSKREWLEAFLALPNGIPCHDTFSRLFSRLDPKQLEDSFQRLMAAWAKRSDGRLIAVDGKTLRRSFDKTNNKAAIHMVSAWCETNRIVLGQLATEAKSNEITAIPELLAMLDIENAVVTIDAMGCQKAIAKKIVDQKGDYVLQVKKNQDKLHDLLVETFDELTGRGIPGVPFQYHEDVGAGHGRIETRRIWTTDWTDWYAGRKKWKGLRSFVCVESVREVAGKTSTERRYYISSLSGQKPVTMLSYVRGHWGIENTLHWSLDMSFQEDEARARVGHSAENLSRIRRLTLNLLKQDRNTKASINNKRFKACMENDYLLKILRIPF